MILVCATPSLFTFMLELLSYYAKLYICGRWSLGLLFINMQVGIYLYFTVPEKLWIIAGSPAATGPHMLGHLPVKLPQFITPHFYVFWYHLKPTSIQVILALSVSAVKGCTPGKTRSRPELLIRWEAIQNSRRTVFIIPYYCRQKCPTTGQKKILMILILSQGMSHPFIIRVT